ncbi:hypothetical protein BIW11_11550 [Tropilaelaps mercedesae]|uniref:Uncharacterized protein n=1 Tax=Tropilaelaps mercedesae TaxID=418985 RepID=A0A1V9XB30_9ACAR|nr:hypothetical protein BIW11_11550 [Tropilaelaps mercedesae]
MSSYGRIGNVDAEAKRIPDSFRDVDQRLTQLQANQSQIAKQFKLLSLRLDQIARDVRIVNGSAQQLRGSIVEAVNNQMPGHLSHLNGSVHNLQSKINSLSGELATVRMELTSVEGRSQQRLHELIDNVNASVKAIEDVISGLDVKSTLSHAFNETVEGAISRAQNVSSSQLEERINAVLEDIKRELAITTPASTVPQPQHLQRQPVEVASQQKEKKPQVKLEDVANKPKTGAVSTPLNATVAPTMNNLTNGIEISDIDPSSSDAKDEAPPVVIAAAAT